MASQLSPIQESLRASCDRCRAKKLACVISTPEQSRTAGQQCERCIRARLKCVFSRRAQTRKGNNGTRRSKRECTRDHISLQRFEIPGDLQQPTGGECAVLPSEPPPCSSMDFTTLLRPSEDFMYGVGLPSVDDHIMRTHIGPSKDEEIFFHTDPLANDFDIPSLPSTVVSAYRSPLLAQGSFDPQGATNERTTSSQFLSASVLVSEIYERTVSLECDPRIPSLSGAEERSDRYSVGPVLELTRRLAAELRHSWRPKVAVQDIQQLRPSTSTYPVSPESMDILSVQQASSEVVDSKSISTEMPDLATTMLMLTGYASLMKLYMVVFSQIHNVLEQLPGSASSHHAPSHGLGESEQLQPGELLAPTSTFEGCSSIYITVQLLLDEFQAVEDIVSFDSLHDQDTSSRGKEKNSLEEAQQQKLPGAELNSHEGWLTRQLEIIRAGLKKDMIRILGNGSQRELTSILQHGHYLKVLLRERMGL